MVCVEGFRGMESLPDHLRTGSVIALARTRVTRSHGRTAMWLLPHTFTNGVKNGLPNTEKIKASFMCLLSISTENKLHFK